MPFFRSLGTKLTNWATSLCTRQTGADKFGEQVLGSQIVGNRNRIILWQILQQYPASTCTLIRKSFASSKTQPIVSHIKTKLVGEQVSPGEASTLVTPNTSTLRNHEHLDFFCTISSEEFSLQWRIVVFACFLGIFKNWKNVELFHTNWFRVVNNWGMSWKVFVRHSISRIEFQNVGVWKTGSWKHGILNPTFKIPRFGLLCQNDLSICVLSPPQLAEIRSLSLRTPITNGLDSSSRAQGFGAKTYVDSAMSTENLLRWVTTQTNVMLLREQQNPSLGYSWRNAWLGNRHSTTFVFWPAKI